MSQHVVVLRNAALSETAVGAQRSPGPSHICRPNAKGELCTYVTECAWLEAWRTEQAAEAAGKAA